LFNLNVYKDNQTAQNELTQGKIQAVIILPAEYSQSIISYQQEPSNPAQWVNATVSLHFR